MSTTKPHKVCEPFLRSRCDQSGLDLDISPFPFEVKYPEFPEQVWTCPHGLAYWTQPTAAEVDRLRELNRNPPADHEPAPEAGASGRGA